MLACAAAGNVLAATPDESPAAGADIEVIADSSVDSSAERGAGHPC